MIVPPEIKELQAYGVERIYSPEDGTRMGLQGMINDVVMRADFDLSHEAPATLPEILEKLRSGDWRTLARVITALENGVYGAEIREGLVAAAARCHAPVLGITGTGGAGKSSLTDELVRRFLIDQEDRLKIAIISIDPSRKRTGGALLGDRIRMNAIDHENLYMRSLATRDTGTEVSRALREVIAAAKLTGYDLIIVETSGIGQGNAAIVLYVDLSLYVMTPEFGAASQLEKIDMLDFADFVAINKFDRKGAKDALRDVAKQVQRNRQRFAELPEAIPVFGTIAARFNDDGVTALYQAMLPRLIELGLPAQPQGRLPWVAVRASSKGQAIIPPNRTRYLAEIAQTVRDYHTHVKEQVRIARERQSLRVAKALFEACGKPAEHFDELIDWKDGQLTPHAKKLLEQCPPSKSSTRKTNTWCVSATRRSAPSSTMSRSRATRFPRWRSPTLKTKERCSNS